MMTGGSTPQSQSRHFEEKEIEGKRECFAHDFAHPAHMLVRQASVVVMRS